MTKGERRAPRLSDRAIVHDLLGASHTALGFASLLAARSDAPDVRRAAVGIQASVRRLVAITEAVSLLDRAPTVDHAAEPVSVDAAVRRAVDVHRELFAAREVDVRLDRASGIRCITSVSVPVLDQLLASVLVWAAFSTPPRCDVRIAVACGNAGALVTVQLAAGAEPDVCVSLAAELAEAVGAQVTLDAARGAISLALPTPTVIDRRAADAAATSESSVLRILHVDDDPMSRALVGMVFGANSECTVVGVGTIAEAQAELARNPIDVVLVDQHLGAERGLDLLRDIHASAAVTPAMFLITGDHDPALRSSAEQLGASIVPKPVDVDGLLQAVLASSAGVSAP